MFSLHLGLLFVGAGIGPALGGLVIRFTGQFINTFYISIVLHAIHALLIWFVVPESLSSRSMRESRARHKVVDEEWRAAHAHGGMLVLFKRLFSFLTPLAIFLPAEVDQGTNPAKGKRRDWSLFFVIIAYAFTAPLSVSRCRIGVEKRLTLDHRV